MSEEKSIVLPGFGDRAIVKELAERLAKMMPGGLNYTPSEALTLAQISVAHGLDPFNGEVWLIKDADSGRVYGALIGLKGMRKHAKRQSNYWGEFERITAQKDLDAYGIGPGDIGFFYRITDEKTAGAHISLAERMYKLGYSLEQIQLQLGKPPHTLGVGVFKAGEKSKMRPTHAAMFRAEKDALKRRFDILWSISIDGQEIPIGQNGDEEPETEHIEAEYIAIEEKTEEPRKPEEIMADLGYVQPEPTAQPAPDTNGKYTEEQLRQAVVDAKLAENVFAAKAALDKCKTGWDTPEKAIAWMTAYRAARELGGDPAQAAKIANEAK